MAMTAVSSTSGEEPMASSRSVVNVAMPQRRGRALPTKAIRSGEENKSPQSLPFGFCIKALTGKAEGAANATADLAFPALGLRTSRLLRFCDLAISRSLLHCSRWAAPGNLVGSDLTSAGKRRDDADRDALPADAQTWTAFAYEYSYLRKLSPKHIASAQSVHS